MERGRFFEKFWNKESKKFSADIADLFKLNLYETMEVVVAHILNRNVESLKILLARTDARYARTFFDYFMGTDTKYKTRLEVNDIIDTVLGIKGADDAKND